ncbi:MAG: FHA domain-containing protein [Planctomycetota bacterium]|nr:FHA domain-containing protein [Planctomycetota bacterium]MDI6787677.1 FHA domain-containing protein [Planctomycetota bacterium]
MAYLIIETDETGKKSYTFPLSDETIIGREKGCNLRIADSNASRRHVRITKEPDGSYLLVDLGSRNGAIVNGIRVSRRKLVDNDRILIGRTTLIYRGSGLPPAQADMPVPSQTAEVGEDKAVPSSTDAASALPKATSAPAQAALPAPAPPEVDKEPEPFKLSSDNIKKAIQELDKAKTSDRKMAGTRPKPVASQEPLVPTGPSLKSRILVFITLVIFFIAILIGGKWLGEKVMSQMTKSYQNKKIPSTTLPK